MAMVQSPAPAIAQDYETSPREEPEDLEPPSDRSPEHDEESTGEFPVAAVAGVLVGAVILTAAFMWLRNRF